MTHSKHSPLPWQIEKDGRIIANRESPKCIAIIQGLASSEQHAAEHPLNMQLIEKAVNSHQSLIEALEGAKRELYNARLVLNRIDKTPTWIKGIDKSIEKIEAALLAARG